jgi:tetratricopeptide (TPR) repeat protein
MTTRSVCKLNTLRFSAAAGLLLTAAMVGCFSSTPKQDWANLIDKVKSSESTTKGTPKFDVVGESLGDSQEVSLTATDLMTRVQGMVTEGRTGAASRWIERHPEATLEWLRSAAIGPGAKSDAVAKLIAQIHDRQCTSAAAKQTWTALDASRRQDPTAYQNYLAARQRFKNSLAQGQVDHALNQELLKLASGCDSQMLEIDAWQLQATAHLLNDKPREAAVAFQKAATAAAPISTYQSAYLLLLLSDAQRRSGDPDRAAATWQQAVLAASQLLATEHPVHDPVLWERLGYQRPVESPWPNDVVSMLQHLEPLPGTDSDEALPANATSDAGADPREAEVSIWNAIGIWYLDRGHPQAALVSFKRAESSATNSTVGTWLRIRQARSLIQLKQEGAATAILVRTAGEKTTPAARAAMGILGSLRLKSGQVQQGYALLRKSVEAEDGVEWPERDDAEVDLALASLMMGRVPEGLQRLHTVQQRFENQGNFESLSMALANEAAYLDEMRDKVKDAKGQSAAIRARLAQLEAAN